MKAYLLAASVSAAGLLTGSAHAITLLKVPLDEIGIEKRIAPPESFATLGISLGMTPDAVKKVALQEGYEVFYEHRMRQCYGDYCVWGNEDKFTFTIRFDKPDSRIYVDFDYPVLGGKAIKISRTDVAENIDIHAVSDGMRQRLGEPADNLPATSHGDYCWAAQNGSMAASIDAKACRSNKMDRKDARYLMTLFRDKMEIKIEDFRAYDDQDIMKEAFNKLRVAEENKKRASATAPKL